MTGFGEATLEAHGVHYFLEIRSLNNKYFKANIRLPEEMQALEPEMESQLRRMLNRGTITVIVKAAVTTEAAAFEINRAALDRYIEQLQDSPHIGSGQVRFDVSALLALPGVLRPPRDEEARLERSREALLKLLPEAVQHLISMRKREGAMLADDLLSHRREIEQKLALVQKAAPRAVEDYENRLRQRIETMLRQSGAAFEPVELIREVAIYAEKSDIAEELSRLSGHLEQFQQLLHNGEERAIGRTLEFLAQEMLREANTIASKSGDAEISRHIVEIKGAIDRIKEQVLNVE